MERRTSFPTSTQITCASWLPIPTTTVDAHDVMPIVLGKTVADGTAGVLHLASYNFNRDEFVSKRGDEEEEEEEEGEGKGEGGPVGIAVHPGGDGVVVSFPKSCNCRYFELDDVKSKLKISDKVLSPLLGVGPQKCLVFSVDGCKLAVGGEDGYLRVFEWPSMQLLLDEPKAQSSFKDLDFSLDSEFLVSTSNDGPARVWDITKAVPLATLARDQGESIEFCRFSRDGTKPFLFCTVTRSGKASITVWDMTTWKKLGGKNFFDKPISAFSISRNGKFLAIGSIGGDICVVEVQKMRVQHLIKRAHVGASITSMEFSSNGRALLSVSTEWAARINPIHCDADWK
ncbi:hypothetical protein KI387_009660, partial [Taxus chinensis]